MITGVPRSIKSMITINSKIVNVVKTATSKNHDYVPLEMAYKISQHTYEEDDCKKIVEFLKKRLTDDDKFIRHISNSLELIQLMMPLSSAVFLHLIRMMRSTFDSLSNYHSSDSFHMGNVGKIKNISKDIIKMLDDKDYFDTKVKANNQKERCNFDPWMKQNLSMKYFDDKLPQDEYPKSREEEEEHLKRAIRESLKYCSMMDMRIGDTQSGRNSYKTDSIASIDKQVQTPKIHSNESRQGNYQEAMVQQYHTSNPFSEMNNPQSTVVNSIDNSYLSSFNAPKPSSTSYSDTQLNSYTSIDNRFLQNQEFGFPPNQQKQHQFQTYDGVDRNLPPSFPSIDRNVSNQFYSPHQEHSFAANQPIMSYGYGQQPNIHAGSPTFTNPNVFSNSPNVVSSSIQFNASPAASTQFSNQSIGYIPSYNSNNSNFDFNSSQRVPQSASSSQQSVYPNNPNFNANAGKTGQNGQNYFFSYK